MNGNLKKDAIEVVKRIKENNFEAYFVGGYVRDFLMNKEPKDIDITTNALPSDIQKMFRYHVDTGIKHGTVSVRPHRRSDLFEVTTYRVDGKYDDGRHPNEVVFTPSLIEDLARRDFTMNAIAMDPIEDTIIDPFNGYTDIQDKVVRCVGEAKQRFMEDPLRVLRAMRFSIKYGFDIEESTKIAMHDVEILKRLDECISKERITDELRKMLTCGKPIRPIFMEFSDIISVIIPEMIPCIGASHNNRWHPHDIYEHILYVVDGCKSNKFEIKLAALLHDIGKPESRVHDDIYNCDHFYGHPKVSFEISKRIFENDLRVSLREKERVLGLVLHHDDNFSGDYKSIRRFVINTSEDLVREWIILKEADINDHKCPIGEEERWNKLITQFELFKNNIDYVMAQENAFKIKDLEIGGKDIIDLLNITPGPIIGKILKELFDNVVDEKVDNNKEDLLKLVEHIYKEIENK